MAIPVRDFCVPGRFIERPVLFHAEFRLFVPAPLCFWAFPDAHAPRHGFWAVFGPLAENFSRSSNVAVRKLPVFDRILERPSWFHPTFGVVQSVRALDVPFGGVFGPDFRRFRFPTRELLRSSTVHVRGFSVFGRISDRPSPLPAVWGCAPPVMCRFERFSQIFGAWAPEIASF